MANILQVQLSDNFNKQRQLLNQAIDYVNANLPLVAGNGMTVVNGNLSVKTTGDGLSFDASGHLVGNDAYPDLMTQVVLDPNGASTVPTTITSTYIDFPAFTVIFDNKVYYGKKISDFTIVQVPATRMNVASGDDGAVYVYVDTSGEIHQSFNSISPQNSATECLLGSYFRLNNQIQSDSWAYTPWNGATSKDNRFAVTGSVAGGLLNATSASTLSRLGMSVLLEGVNVSNSLYNPNKILYPQESPYSSKELWPGYDANVPDSSTLDTTHIYNMTDHTVDDISQIDGYIILIPGIVAPTGQDVYLMGMSPKVDNSYTQIYSTMADALNALYGLQVELGNVASRVLWIGQSIIVKIGATNYSDASQLKIVGDLPNILGAYSSAASGGAGSRVSGITIKSNGTVVGDVDQKTVLDFDSDFTVLNMSGNEVSIATNIQAASQATVNSGTDTYAYVTPATLKGQNYLATKEYVGKILQQKTTTTWPSSTDVSVWPHTIIISTSGSITMSTVQPSFTGDILTWEVVVKNTSNSSIALNWPSIYQPFNNENLPSTIAPNTSIFMMMRRYSGNYTLVSIQGNQSNNLM